MLVLFYVAFENGKIKPRHMELVSALTNGARLFGDTVGVVHNGMYSNLHEEVDVVCCWGVAGNTKEIIEGYTRVGKRVLLFDKALIRHMSNTRSGHFRVGMDGLDSLKYLMRKNRLPDRWEDQGIKVEPRKPKGGSIIYTGSSQKYCDYYELGDANEYARKVFEGIRQFGGKDFELIYRPKPSWRGAEEIKGTRFSDGEEPLMAILEGDVHLLVTHGSASAVEAMIMGVPVITLGPCIAQPVASHNIGRITDPFFPTEKIRYQWLCNLAYCQWTAEELKSGKAWKFLRDELKATEKKVETVQ